MHLIDFYWIIKFKPHEMTSVMVSGIEMEDTYTLVSSLFKTSVVYCILYVLGGVLLGFHLSHGFWSAFQTLGLSNKNWLSRLQFLGKIYAVVVAIGFSAIPLYFLIKF
jgi:succinate dehydrogenase / fumarate reductase cytochrome b subunit